MDPVTPPTAPATTAPDAAERTLDGLPPVLTLAEAAQFMRMSTTGYRRAAEEGRVPGRRYPAGWRVMRDDLATYLRGDWTSQGAPTDGEHEEDGED